MIKKKILTYLGKLIEFLNVRLKIKNQPLSPAEIYYQDVSKESYESFKNILKTPMFTRMIIQSENLQ